LRNPNSPLKKDRPMTREQVRGVDRWAIEDIGVPGVVLMENAGRNCAEIIMEKLADRAPAKVCIFCGTGNNGGDGYVVARHLINNGFEVKVIICGDRGKIKGDAKINLDILEKLARPVDVLDMTGEDIGDRAGEFIAGADMLVDSIFGTGLKGQLSAEYIELIDAINASGLPILAVDIPSGLDCDNGEVLGAAVKAAYTVTFVAAKTGFAEKESAGAAYAGEVFVTSIGIDFSEDFKS